MITKTNQSLSNIFDVEPTVPMPIVIPSETVETKVEASTQDTDFEIARLTMHNIMIKGQEAIANALVIANGSEEADSYMAVSNLIGKMTDASTKLMGLHELKMKVNAKVTAPPPPLQLGVEGQTAVNISGPVFVGTTSELSKMVQDQRKIINITGA